MFFIWGWGHRKNKDLGSVNKAICSNCSNITKFRMLDHSEWFTFFFIPIIPYSKKKFVYCPVCDYAIEIDEDNALELKQIANLNNAYDKGDLSEDEYEKLNNKLNSILEIGTETLKSDVVFNKVSIVQEPETGLTKFLKSKELKILLYSVFVIAVLYLVF